MVINNMKNIWHDFNKKRINSNDFFACIEIPKGSKKKYELDKETGMIILDRVLYTSTIYPANYGFIPLTYAEDKDPLDVLVLCQETLDPLVLVRVKPIGLITMTDEKFEDSKIIAVPFGDPEYSCYDDIHDLPSHLFEEIRHFFSVYKQLELKETEVKDILGHEDAIDCVQRAINAYTQKFGNEE